ncbi:peptidase [Lysobacteraceae bacterium NML75-0749]|nr:peptidase [Xanthomonadaceae bacterium NML75-0749]PJK02659.1 peptidase [Xanthomonadaceae bacterium NML91-0268]
MGASECLGFRVKTNRLGRYWDRRMRKVFSRSLMLLCVLLAGCASVSGSRRAAYDYYQIGDVAAATPGRVQPGLMLVGGGEWPQEAFRWFFGRAGHGHIVVLRASMQDQNQREMYRRIGGVTSVRTLVFHRREAAFDPEVLAVIESADGIFIGGGDQARYLRFWQGTPVQAAINRHVAAGKPLGGTSAGLAVQGRHVYGALDDGSLTSQEALADSRTSGITLVSDFLRLEPLYSSGVLTDTHFNERQRQARLMTMLAHLAERDAAAPLLGLGVDEETALCIDETGQGKLYSQIGGYAWLFRPGNFRLETGKALQAQNWQVTGIGTQSRVNARTWQVENPAFESKASIHAGRLQFVPAVPLKP